MKRYWSSLYHKVEKLHFLLLKFSKILVRQLLLLLKSFLLDEEELNRSYLFFVNSQEVSVSLAETLKHQLIDYETTLCIVYQPQEVSRVSGLTGRPLASGAGDKTLFHGYDSDEIHEAEMKRPKIYDSEEDEYVPEYKLVPKPRSQGQSVSPPNILVGSKSRLKVLVLDKFPSREMGNSKLPKGEKVMLCFFHHLRRPDRKHSTAL